MKKLIIIYIFTLIFFFPATNGFSDILTDLKNFEESLSDWVKQTNELSQRLVELEGERGAREKQIADFNQSMADIGILITDLNDKVDRVANMASLKGVKDIIKSFEGTLDVFKNRFSELAKRLEDQEVKTAVLERIYKTTQKPIETLINSIDEQKGGINKLAERLDKQENLILSLEESLKKQAPPAEFSAKSIEDLNARLSKLESGIIVQKSEEKKEFEEIPKEVSKKVERTEADVESEKDVEASEVSEKTVVVKEDTSAGIQPEKAEALPEKKTTEANGYIDIGEGFLIKNVKFYPFGSSTRVSGEMTNKSDRDYGMINFKIQAYDNENVFLGGHEFSIYGFKRGEIETFEEVVAGIKLERIIKYSVSSARIKSVSDTGEMTIKMIEREPLVAKAETKKADTKESTPENLEELLFDKGKKESIKELEGFDDVGNGFYAGNVSFNSFGSSSTVTGVIKNNSKKDFFNATFIMKIFSEAYGMITSFEFSVRRIKSGEMKTFEEIVTGVNPVDISRHEIVYKSSY